MNPRTREITSYILPVSMSDRTYYVYYVSERHKFFALASFFLCSLALDSSTSEQTSHLARLASRIDGSILLPTLMEGSKPRGRNHRSGTFGT